MMVATNRSETRYLLERALRTRNLFVGSNGDTVHAANTYGFFSLTLMPSNCRVLISSHVQVHEIYRGKGNGRKLLNLREEIAKEIGCNLILATVRNDNVVESHLLKSSGWQQFNSRDTGVSLWGKEL
jgi:GNAT superfamily N-acetyltransferase